MGTQDRNQPESHGRSALSVYLLRDIAHHRIVGVGYGTLESFSWAHGAERQDFELIDRNLTEYSVIADGLGSQVHAEIVANGVFTAVRANQLALTQLEALDWARFDSSKIRQAITPGPLTAAGTLAGRSGRRRPMGLARADAPRPAGGFDLFQKSEAAPRAFSDPEHRERLEDLVLQQAQEMAALNSTLDQIRALRDLSAWAQRTSSTSDAVILASDLSLALGDRLAAR
jgi:hypothetical protein